LVDFREVKNNSSEWTAAGRRDDEKAMRSRVRNGDPSRRGHALIILRLAFRPMDSIAAAQLQH
jgi:hypothetical protein